ncbi:hypothetical protein A3A74_01960 [Candidatus Roizmanbacteria bacterium RIFCSPLOWO2_01_FULL_35_13]|uniref:Uncharacterized protein n=1 Tax=Candidatus Roizmanbacteria bacterium RIFCSPLOWO2_01_FULL_35_13 TaxID=1802055 RepID=A0A1F7I9P1_9BACT|nr:MAG: hypothetical protein A3A74_01960 [Candidatus Roizmanbacteria bacterium RIFCSPLOWO2_01_FULL_35_13]
MDTNNLPDMFKGKRLMIIGGGLVVLLIVLIVFSAGSRTKSSNQTFPQPTQSVPPAQEPDMFNNNQDANSPEVQQAIAEQMQADQEYNSWQQSNSDAYSWIRKLPLTADNYFVYFDLTKKVFIGRLYPKSGDDLEKIKSDVLNKLKTEKEIPVENFTFQWQVNP